MILRLLVICLAWLGLPAVPAFAADKAEEPEIVRLIFEAVKKKEGVVPEYGSIEAEDGRIILRDLTLAPEDGGKESAPATIGTVIFDGVQKGADGLYRMRRLILRDFVIRDGEPGAGGLKIRAPEVLLTDVSFLPESAARNAREKMAAGSLLSSTLAVDTIYFEKEDGAALVLRGLRGAWRGDRRTGMGEGRIDFGRLPVPVSLISEESGDTTLREMGYDNIILGAIVSFANRWGEDDRVHTDFALRFGADNMGYQEIEIADLALPASLIEKLGTKEGQEQIVENFFLGGGSEDLGNVTLRGLKLKWIDRSLARRLVDHFAKKEGLDRKTYIDNIVAWPQVMLMQFGLPQLAASASEELRKFLEEPKTLTVSFQARAPMSLSTFMTLLADPAGLVDTLGLKVEANAEAP